MLDSPAQTTINDSVDTTTATLTASPSVTEGGVITYTVTLSNPAQTPVTVTLSNGQTITVEAGAARLEAGSTALPATWR
nr:immunoglobulin-like domain-containing protein [Pseudomonas putida]